MKLAQPRPTSFRRFNLRHEISATSLAALTLLAGSWVSVDQLERRLLRLQRSDLERVDQLLQEHIGEARRQLDIFAALPTPQRQTSTALLLPVFADVYQLNDRLEVQQVLLGSHGSRVFRGFSFVSSAIRAQLERTEHTGPASSPIMRSHEDENPGVYITDRDPRGALLLGRVRLAYLRAFMDRYSQGSGLPLLLISRDGYVKLTSASADGVAAVDLSHAATGLADPLLHRNRRWRPVVAPDHGLGGHFVSLIPVEQLEQQRRLVLLPSVVVTLLALAIFWHKNRRMNQLLFAPLARFSERIQTEELRLRQGQPETAADVENSLTATSRFQELGALQASFGRLIATIGERDAALRQAHQRQQQREEEQRRELRNKLQGSLMAASVAHEIKLPLATIRMLCDQAQQQIRSNPARLDTASLVASLSSQSQQVNAVIETMRMLLRTVETSPSPVDPLAVLQGACRAVKPLLRHEQVQLECRGFETASGFLIRGDGVQLQMALTNLLRNAIEAVALEQPPPHRQVRLSLSAESSGLVVEVADNGPGFRVDPREDTLLHSSKPTGSGLGLFVVRTTVAHHHGQLRFGRCPELGGARVSLHLPATSAEVTPTASAQTRTKEHSS